MLLGAPFCLNDFPPPKIERFTTGNRPIRTKFKSGDRTMKSVSRVCALLCIATLKVFCLARLGAAFSAFIAQEELSLLYVNTTFASDVEGECVLVIPPSVSLHFFHTC